MKIIRITLAVIVVVLAVAVVITEGSRAAMITPYMLIGLGLLNIFNGVCLYRENKRIDAIMLFLAGLFVIIVAILKYV